MSKRIVIESPLNGPTPEAIARNFRFLLWCCRAVWWREGLDPIASHLLNPWFMDDSVPHERQAGINNEWVWGRYVQHLFFADLGMSEGMLAAEKRCRVLALRAEALLLAEYAPECWTAFERGEWPPHTKGFEIARTS